MASSVRKCCCGSGPGCLLIGVNPADDGCFDKTNKTVGSLTLDFSLSYHLVNESPSFTYIDITETMAIMLEVTVGLVDEVTGEYPYTIESASVSKSINATLAGLFSCNGTYSDSYLETDWATIVADGVVPALAAMWPAAAGNSGQWDWQVHPWIPGSGSGLCRAIGNANTGTGCPMHGVSSNAGLPGIPSCVGLQYPARVLTNAENECGINGTFYSGQTTVVTVQSGWGNFTIDRDCVEDLGSTTRTTDESISQVVTVTPCSGGGGAMALAVPSKQVVRAARIPTDPQAAKLSQEANTPRGCCG